MAYQRARRHRFLHPISRETAAELFLRPECICRHRRRCVDKGLSRYRRLPVCRCNDVMTQLLPRCFLVFSNIRLSQAPVWSEPRTILPGFLCAITFAFASASLHARASGSSSGWAVSSMSGDCWLNVKPNVVRAWARYLEDDPSIISVAMMLWSSLRS